MHAVVTEVARAVIEEPPPGAMKSPRIERQQWRGTEPEVVIEAGWRLSVGRLADRALFAAFPRLGKTHFADRAGLQIFNAREQVRAAARLRAELHDAAIFLRRCHHRAAFENVVPVRLLDIDVFAGLAGV